MIEWRRKRRDLKKKITEWTGKRRSIKKKKMTEWRRKRRDVNKEDDRVEAEEKRY